MPHLEKVVYTAKAYTTGGRDGGVSRTSDGRLAVQLSTPGGTGNGTNPEQLFAVGWSACFLSAIKIIAGKKRIKLPDDIAIDIEIDLGIDHGVHGLAARLNIMLPGMVHEDAQTLAEGAHLICPYSRATHGNIDVGTNVVTDFVALKPAATVRQ
jgi:lipoyl-dependent peroxiredoxin